MMKKFGICLLAIGMIALSGCGSVDKEKLIGVWEVVDGPDNLPKGTTMEFTADNKVKMGAVGVPISIEIGSYELSGNIIALKKPGTKDGKARITKLEGDDMVMKDDDVPKDIIFKRKSKAAGGDGKTKGKE